MKLAETIRYVREPLRKSTRSGHFFARWVVGGGCLDAEDCAAREEGLKLKAIRLQGKNPGPEIGLLRLIDSGGNRVVGVFTELAQVTVPKMIEK
jgi:hypothetical protein